MRSRRIAALITAVALWAVGPQALASGLIGSVSGVNEGEDVRSANQGQLTAEESYDNALGAPTDGAQTGAGPATGATIDLGIGETTVSPQTTTGVGATGDAGQATSYQLGALEQELYQRLQGTVPAEGWHVQFVGESTLAMVTMPELIVWDIDPESGVMELKWYRHLTELLGEGASSPSVDVSPDGNYALVMPSDGSVYLLGADVTEQVAPPGTAPGRMIWADDSQSYAYIVDSEIHVFMLDGRELLISGRVITPVANELEWLNPAPTPEALEALLNDENWVLAGMNRNCVLFDSADGSYSRAYVYATGAIVDYPQVIHSSDNIGRSGACPILDEASQRYRLYMGDGSYSDIPVLDIISSGTVNNMYGWLGDSICVLEQDSSSRSTFRLHAANTATGITYTLLTPWEYADMVNSASANSSEPTGTPVSGIISSMQSGEDAEAATEG